LAFKRQVAMKEAETYAAKHQMSYFEVSPLCDFNIRESFSELSRMALHRNGMERLWRSNKVLSLQELCCRAIVARTSVYSIDQLPLPNPVKSHLKSYALTSFTSTSMHRYLLNPGKTSTLLGKPRKFVGMTCPNSVSPSSMTIDHSRTSCVGRNSCSIS